LTEEKRRWNIAPGESLCAELVESVRIDGQPCQRIVAYLGAIKSEDAQDLRRGYARGVFWRSVAQRLAATQAERGAFSAAEVERILARLGEVVLLEDFRRERMAGAHIVRQAGNPERAGILTSAALISKQARQPRKIQGS
jgi:hypothetical protein